MKSPRDSFIQTQWSVILAFDTQNPLQSDRAMSYLCETYWKPLFAFCLKKGHKREMAEDLVQSFFATFLKESILVKQHLTEAVLELFFSLALEIFLMMNGKRTVLKKRWG